MTAARSFQMAAKGASDSEYEAISYDFGDAEGNTRTIVANFPGEGALMLMAAATAGDEPGAEAVSELFEFLKESLSSSDFAFLRSRVRSKEISVPMLVELISDMVEQWSSFPTKPSSGSAPKRQSTGTKSTGSSRAKA